MTDLSDSISHTVRAVTPWGLGAPTPRAAVTGASWPQRRALAAGAPGAAQAAEPAEEPGAPPLADRLAALRRPRLLIRAARFGQAEYSRTRDLRRVLQIPAAPSPEAALHALIRTEQELETARRQGTAAYSLLRHIDVLIALMAEARLLPARGTATGQPG